MPKGWKQGLQVVFRETIAPTPAPGLWDWSTTQVVLPSSETSTLGNFSPTRAAPFKRFHDIVAARKLGRPVSATDPHAWRCEQLWVVWSAQCGKTVSTVFPAHAWCSKYFPHQPSGFFWPTIDLKKAQMRDRLEPLWQATPHLSCLMPTPGSEDYTRRIGDRTWRLSSGLRAGMRVGGIANDLRANPYANLFFDEFDALKANVGGQGDPIGLAQDRQRTFGADSMTLGVTTPSTVEGHGWRRLCSGSHERLMVKCPDCEGRDWPNPDQLRPLMPTDAQEGDEEPTPQAIARDDLAVWCCRWCGARHRTDAWRTMVREALERDEWSAGTYTVDEEHPRGHWVPLLPIETDAEGKPTGRWKGIQWPVIDAAVRSAHGNLLMTDVWTLGKFLAEERLAMAGSEADRQKHWNTARAEPYFTHAAAAATDEERLQVVDRELVRGVVPAGTQYLILMLDQQGNTDRLVWFPWVLRAILPGGESWLVDCGKVPQPGKGDEPGGWEGVAHLCAKTWPQADDLPAVRPQLFAMDGANGVMAKKVRAWAAEKPTERILVWGNPKLHLDEPWKLYVPGKRAKIPWPDAVKGYEINSNYWRDRVDERRRRLLGAPGWWLPDDVPGFYLRSVWDSEVRVVVQRQVTGQGVRDIVAWERAVSVDSHGKPTYRRDNHWWDCEVALAAIMNVYSIDHIVVKKIEPPKTARVDEAQSIPRPYAADSSQVRQSMPQSRRQPYQRKFSIRSHR